MGSGPNGLAAAIVLAQAGVRVTVLEAEDTIGGGARTQELTLPGFLHDVCSAIHPMAAASPFFRSLPLAEHGLSWVQPDIPLAHPFDDGSASTIRRSLDETARLLGEDGPSYKRLMSPVTGHWDDLAPAILGPVLRLPRHPLLMARFGLNALQPATRLAGTVFKEARTRALFAGMAAHANVPLDGLFTAGTGIVLGGAAHPFGWPIAAGGSRSITAALAGYLRSLGGKIDTGRKVESMSGLNAGAVLFDLTPRQVLRIAGPHLSQGYRRALSGYRYGAGAFKVDYALSGPIPWTAAECRSAGTVHLGGSIEEIVLSEALIGKGVTPERPFTLVAQQSLFDSTRAPDGKQTAWAYCHVPNGSSEDLTDRIEAQIERFAPGFHDLVLARHVTSVAGLEAYNENYVGGDIAGGSVEGLQLFFRPARRVSPYTTSDRRLYPSMEEARRNG